MFTKLLNKLVEFLGSFLAYTFRLPQYLGTHQFPVGWIFQGYEMVADRVLNLLGVATKKWMKIKGVVLIVLGVFGGLLVVHFVSDILGLLLWLFLVMMGLWFIISGLVCSM